MPNCYEKIITISPKLATLASGQIVLMMHRHTHTQTQRQPTYMADLILPCNKLNDYHIPKTTIVLFKTTTGTQVLVHPGLSGMFYNQHRYNQHRYKKTLAIAMAMSMAKNIDAG